MTLAAVLAAAALDPGSYLFERARAAHTELRSARVTAEFRTEGLFGAQTRRVEVAYDAQGGFDVSVGGAGGRRVVATGDMVYDVDPVRFAFASRERGDEPREETLGQIASLVDPVVLAIVGGAPVGAWLDQQGSGGQWALRPGRALMTLVTRARTGQSSLELDADHRIAAYEVRSQEGTSRWTFRYASLARPVSFLPPGGYRRVTSLMAATAPPQFADTLARTAFERAMAPYDSPKRLSVEFRGSGQRVGLWVESGAIRQDDGTVDWAFDGERLSLLDRRQGVFVEGRAGVSDVFEAVERAGSRVDPVASRLMAGVNPFRDLLGDRARVRVAGRIALQGRPTLILESVAEERQFSFFVTAEGYRLVSFAGSVAEWGAGGTREVVTVPRRPAIVAAPRGGRRMALAQYLPPSASPARTP